MDIYDAICASKEARELLPKVAQEISQAPSTTDSIIETEKANAHTRLVRRAIALMGICVREKCPDIVRQLAQPSVADRLISDFSGYVMQVIPSSRWEKRYEREVVFDVVVAVPEFAKTIAFSTTELRSDEPVETLQVYDALELSNFHTYPFFNRAHAVTLREAKILKTGDRSRDFGKFKFLLRTSQHASMIGQSSRLHMFTPIQTVEGLRLGFYFATVCRVIEVNSVRAESGFGFDLSQSDVVFADEFGKITVRLSYEVFMRSIQDPIQLQYASDIKDPRNLVDYKGWLLIVAVWFFRGEEPYVAFIGFLGNDPKLRRYSTLAYANSIRKLRRSELGDKLGHPDPPLANLLEIGNDVYYREDAWRTDFSSIALQTKFRNLSFSEGLRYGLTYAAFAEYQNFCLGLRKFFSMRPDLEALYQADDPVSTFKELFNRSGNLDMNL
jgi:hypothetical protein